MRREAVGAISSLGGMTLRVHGLIIVITIVNLTGRMKQWMMGMRVLRPWAVTQQEIVG
jgi:hypothetical protein